MRRSISPALIIFNSTLNKRIYSILGGEFPLGAAL